MEFRHSEVTKFVRQFGDEMADEEQVVKEVYEQVSRTCHPDPQLQQKLRELNVEEPHGVEVTKDTGSSRLTEHQLRQIYGDSFKKGRFNSKEIKTICSNWCKFTAKYEIENPMVFVYKKGSEMSRLVGSKNLLHFKMFLSQGLPGRSLSSVYKTWMSQYCETMKQSRFTEAETRLLQLLSQISEEKGDDSCKRLNILALALQRSKKAVENKLKELATPQATEDVDWTLHREEEVVREVVRATNANSLDDLRELHNKMVWRDVTNELSLSKRQAYYRWHYHIAPALFPTKWRTRLHLQTDLVRRLQRQLRKGKVVDWVDVDWVRLARRVGDYGSLYVYRLVMSLRWNHVRDKDTRNNMTESLNKLEHVLLELNNASSLRLSRPPAEAHTGRCLRRAKFSFRSRRLKNINPPWTNLD